ncbi:MAG: peptidase M13 [Bacteroidetes bacterium]|nr:MAG: peptidase M13 [Bacteroidota bacterium]
MRSLMMGALLSVGIIGCTTMEKRNMAIDPANLDESVSPREDFYRYANGGWLENNPLPDDRSRYGSFDALADKSDEQIKQLFDALGEKSFEQGSNGQKIADFYASGMNEDAVNQQGFDGIKYFLDAIERIKTEQELQTMITRLFHDGIYPVFYLYGGPDSKNSDWVVAHLHQGGLSMPDRDYYLNTDERSETVREAYKKYVTAMFELIKSKTPEQRMEQVLAFETRLAKASRSREALRNPEANYNPVTLAELKSAYSAFDWDLFFARLYLQDPGKIINGQPEFMAEFNKMLTDTDLDVWKSYLTFKVVNGFAAYLSEPFVQQRFDFYGKTLQGQPQMLPRWKRVLNTTSGYLDEAVGQLYVEAYFPPEAKERMIRLIDNLKRAFEMRIKNLTWMDQVTKEKALKKLDAVRVKVGYPDKWKSYENLKIVPDSYVANVIAANQFSVKENMEKMNKPVDKEEWHMPPQMVNAYYSPNGNEIVFPAAILQPPFFFQDADDAVNYGAIGVVIGHEMTHGFDDQGRKYDLKGNLNDWWLEEDAKRFEERTQKLVDLFDSFVVLDTVHANGALTLGENIADLGGLNIAYQALKLALNGDEEKIAGFTPEQRFFLAYAHVWGQNIRDEEILHRTKVDVHSLGVFRVNGPLPNMPEFYEAFGIVEGDPMYLEESKRVFIW